MQPERLMPESLTALLEPFAGLAGLLDREPATLRKLYSLLFHREPLVQWRAVLGLGVLARERPDKVRRILSRLAFSLNDEASTCGWVTAPAVAEIAANNPGLAREVVRIVVHYITDQESCHSVNRNVVVLCSALWAVGRVGRGEPELAREVLPVLEGFTRDPEPMVRAHAWWALRHAGLAAPTEIHDPAPARVFDPETAAFRETTVAEFAHQASGSRHQVSGIRENPMTPEARIVNPDS